MYHPFIVGKKLYLRGLERSDLEGDYSSGSTTGKVTRFMDSGIFPNTQEKWKNFTEILL